MKINSRPSPPPPSVQPAANATPAEPRGGIAGSGFAGDSDFECKRAPLVELSGLPPKSAVPLATSLSLKGAGWSDGQLRELASMSSAVTETYDVYYRQNLTLLGAGSGVVANLWGTAKLDLSRGCRDHQTMSYAAAKGDQRRGSELEVHRLGIGHGAEHHAVVVYPKGTDWKKTGVVIDPWTKQSTKADDFLRPIETWKGEHALAGMVGRARLED